MVMPKNKMLTSCMLAALGVLTPVPYVPVTPRALAAGRTDCTTGLHADHR